MKDEIDKETDELMARAARLPQGVAPPRDLWPAIEAGLSRKDEPRKGRWNTVWMQAAAVVLLVGGSSALTYTVMKSGADATTPGIPAATTLVFEPVSGSFGSQYNLGPDYLDARRDLAAGFDAELAALEPETRTAVVANLETIQQAIRDLNKALAEEPDNVLLQELLLSTYRDELALMRKVDGISGASMRRDDI